MTSWRTLKTALLLFGTLFPLAGVAYPIMITAIAESAFPYQAHGSLVENERGVVIGSELIGQNFSGPLYFEGRPSSTHGSPYNASRSGGSNLGPSNPVLSRRVNASIHHLERLGIRDPWPGDLVTSSASGLDPHVTLDAALLQVPAVAKARGMSNETLKRLVLSHVESDPFSLENLYVNVFSLNRALDGMSTP